MNEQRHVVERDVSTFGVQRRAGLVHKHFPYEASSEHVKQESIRLALLDLRMRVPESHVSPSDPLVLVMEDIGTHETLNELIARDPNSDRVKNFVRRCAKAASAIHGIQSERMPRRKVTLHGDFSPQNVLVSENELWVIDASPNYYSTFVTRSIGTRSTDLATFTLKLIWPFRPSTFRQLIPRLRLRKLFISTYEVGSGTKVVGLRHCLNEAILLSRYLIHRKVLKSHKLGNPEE